MNEPGKFGSAIVFLAAGVVCLILVSLPFVSWRRAGRDAAIAEKHFRWCVVTQTPVARGLKINHENVSWAVKRLSENEDFIADKSQAIGKYAWADLAEGEILKPAHFSDFAPTKVPLDGAAVPVEVKTEHAGSIKPGMRLAFVQEKEKPVLMIPDAKNLTGKQKSAGFEVISIAVSSKDASITTLTLAVEKNDLASVRDLANGQWRPVILR